MMGRRDRRCRAAGWLKPSACIAGLCLCLAGPAAGAVPAALASLALGLTKVPNGIIATPPAYPELYTISDLQLADDTVTLAVGFRILNNSGQPVHVTGLTLRLSDWLADAPETRDWPAALCAGPDPGLPTISGRSSPVISRTVSYRHDPTRFSNVSPTLEACLSYRIGDSSRTKHIYVPYMIGIDRSGFIAGAPDKNGAIPAASLRDAVIVGEIRRD